MAWRLAHPPSVLRQRVDVGPGTWFEHTSAVDSKREDDVARRAALSPLLRASELRPLSASVKVEIGTASKRGRARALNEDHYLVVEFGRYLNTLSTSLPRGDVPDPFEEYAYAMLIADGLGGDGRGGVASRVALSTLAHVALHFGHWNLRVDPDVAEQILDRAEWYGREADRAVYRRSLTNPELANMTTTLTAAYSAGDDLFIANVGHSRAYLFRDGIMTRLTRDDTLQQHFLDAVRPAPVDRGVRDLGHILTDTLGGGSDQTVFQIDHFKLRNGDCVLLCTNGLTDAVTEDTIAELLMLRRSADDQCRALVECAVDGRAEDNATVILAQYVIPTADAVAAL